MSTESTLLKQHVIDPEICIRCNTCEAICPVGAITHDSRNYVVKADTVFTGYLQHLVNNRTARLVSDMTESCALTP